MTNPTDLFKRCDGAVLAAQKAALLDAVRRGLVAQETAEKEIAEIDRRLLRIAASHDSASHTSENRPEGT